MEHIQFEHLFTSSKHKIHIIQPVMCVFCWNINVTNVDIIKKRRKPVDDANVV